MALERMKVRVAFSSLHCYDEADGAGSAEPYLWALYFTIDGSSVTLDLNANNQLVLRGTSTNIGSPGSLGNLGTNDVDAHETRDPAACDSKPWRAARARADPAQPGGQGPAS